MYGNLVIGAALPSSALAESSASLKSLVLALEFTIEVLE